MSFSEFMELDSGSDIGRKQKPLFLPIMAYTLSTTKLEIRAK
jgi:hypothetical protein